MIHRDKPSGSSKFRVPSGQPDHLPMAERSQIVNQRSPGETERSCYQGFVHMSDIRCVSRPARAQINGWTTHSETRNRREIMPTKISPCLWFDHQAEDATRFYTAIFKDSKIVAISRYPEAGQEIHGKPAGSVLTVAFELNG